MRTQSKFLIYAVPSNNMRNDYKQYKNYNYNNNNHDQKDAVWDKE